MNALILAAAVIMLATLLFFEKKEIHAGMAVSKAGLSSLFILFAVVQPHPAPEYYRTILIGLIFCLGGDVCLALPQEKMFKVGLISFLLGHVVYGVAFFRASALNIWTGAGSAIVGFISILIFLWLKPHLGKMKIPVLVYILVITVMLAGAFTIFGDKQFPFSGRIIVLCGAALFYISDIFVARHRFYEKAYINRIIGLPLYNAGQFLLAFSVGLITAG